MKKQWNDKRYHSLDYELRTRYGEKMYKISLDGGFTCPNRDGTLEPGAVFSAAREGPVTLLQTDICLSQNRLRPEKHSLWPNMQAVDISPIFRRIPAPMHRYPGSGLCLWKPSVIRISGFCPLPPGPTVWSRRSLIFWKNSGRSNRYGSNWDCRPSTRILHG